MNYPTPPSGSSPQASFFRRLMDCLKRSRPIAGSGLTYRETDSGTILSLINPTQFGQGGGSEVRMFAVTQLLGKDWVMAKYWDGTSLGAEVAVAKSPRLRFSITSELVDDVTITYTPLTTYPFDLTGDNNRTADDGTNNEKQVVFPRYTTLTYLGTPTPASASSQAILFAAKPMKGTGVKDDAGKPVDWVEISPARVWARRYNQ